MRLENLGRVPVRLEQPSLELLSGDFDPFGPAQIVSADPQLPPILGPGESANYELRFPMPGGRHPDSVNFAALNLRFTLDFDGERVTTGVQFLRAYRDGYPYHGHVRFGFTYGYAAYCD